ncbi:NAD(P)-binding protein [Wolfiporia cocos MD-104 SS10]|uniref:NAD(P)-binding protein n=1 Tax=Wolfiporia cocos (strain MD-104) TaxID=742152 RepID=A0A2H3IX91_WOLCO|nr:NAD(P)-binding protein [Wolfiporia cocos MD-104 SS10]
MPAIPPNSLIVITGINGYIASHVGLAALQAGYRVRGTLRSLARSEEVKAGYTAAGADIGALEFVAVDDFTSDAQLDAAFAGATGVAHIALPGGLTDSNDDLPALGIASNQVVLRAVRRTGTVRRVVFTSSSVASVMQSLEYHEHTVTDADWNDKAVALFESATEDDKKSSTWPWLRYAALKTLSERAVWKWVDEEKPEFDIVTILPNANWGPVLFGEPRSTVYWIYELLQNNDSTAKSAHPQWFIDVRDDGRLHVLALATPSLGGKRIWAAAEPFGWNKVLSILRKHFPHVKVPEDIPGPQGEPDPQRIDSTVAAEALGGWIGIEKSVVDTAKSLGF